MNRGLINLIPFALSACCHIVTIGVRDGGAGGQLPPQFGQFVDMNSGRESTLFGQNTIHVWITRIKGLLLQLTEKNTNLGSATGVNGKNSATPHNMDPGKLLLLPPPHWIWIPENVCYYPPPTESIRAKLGLPPKWMLARTPMIVTV